MRTYTTEHTVYNFDELNPEAQNNAIEKLWDLNVEFKWWDYLYEDAERIGMKITEFDLDRHEFKAEFTECPLDICKVIMEEHGKGTTTYQRVIDYLAEREILSKKEVTRLCQEEADQLCEHFSYACGAFDVEQNYFDEDVFEDINDDFHDNLKNEYFGMLKEEYNYLTSREQIIETIQTNEYDFTENGDLA